MVVHMNKKQEEFKPDIAFRCSTQQGKMKATTYLSASKCMWETVWTASAMSNFASSFFCVCGLAASFKLKPSGTSKVVCEGITSEGSGISETKWHGLRQLAFKWVSTYCFNNTFRLIFIGIDACILCSQIWRKLPTGTMSGTRMT